MASGNPRPDDNYSSDGGDTTDAESSDESPHPPRRGPGANPILTRLSVSRNPSPLAAATAAPGVCLLRFAWESAAGSLVGAVVGYGNTAVPSGSTSSFATTAALGLGLCDVWSWLHF